MSLRAAWDAAARRCGRIRVAAIPVLVVLAVLIALEPPWTTRLASAWFDLYQLASPRHIASMPATIVAIDQKSLSALGQWPWPRSVLAQLVDDINRDGPLAIGIDIVMPEPDAHSAERALARAGRLDPAIASPLAALPPGDGRLARSLSAAPTVLAVVESAAPSPRPLRAPAIGVLDSAAGSAGSTAVAPDVVRFEGALTSIDELDGAAPGHGLISVVPEGGIIRRVPLVASVHGTLMPALAIEMMRVALGAPPLRVRSTAGAVDGIEAGEFFAPTERDGSARLHFSPHNADRFVSAIDVLERNVDPDLFRSKLVLVGVTGAGMIEEKNTPLGVPMPGVEIHAQLLESLYDGTLLRRPAWAPRAESLAFLLLGTLLVAGMPRWKAQQAGLFVLCGVAALLGAGHLLFRTERLVFDTATPALALLALFGVLLVASLADATRQRRALERLVQEERERSARVAGELEAAKRIQTAMLPSAGLVRGDGRIDLAATMVPAREVGGDLYDFFRLDNRRLFFLVGDVAGKGLSASIFMAVSKALCKSTMLRAPDADIGVLMSAANAEVSRDNPEMLFVTAFAGILDLESGELAYCNAGHENPYLRGTADDGVQRIEDGDGPPLCTVDDYPYRGARRRMRPGDEICVVTDGVTEAPNPAGEMYGGERVRRRLSELERPGAAAAVVAALRTDVETFAAGAEPADDLTVFVLRWNGAGAPA